jgi:hypothetical protein
LFSSDENEYFFRSLYDGVTIRSSCENEGDFDKFFSRNLLKFEGEKLILVVYVRVESVGENKMGG